MNLDREMCSRARLARDARFDGKFFIAVRSTRIYCRPICPARTSKEENVEYFPTAAAAAEAGFRPCLRCRPECSPGTPASFGTSNTVSRALRLISEAGLEEGGVELLADRLGVGSRHLRRLFLKHLGATPTAVAQTRRLQFAKKLIDETALPMTEVAFASGFGCVRRFNAAVSKTYHRTPTQIRSLAQRAALYSKTNRSEVENDNRFALRLHFRPPFSWKAMLAFLADYAIPGVEALDGSLYRRSISLNGSHGYFEIFPGEPENSLFIRIEFGDPRSLFAIVERVRAMFDLNADWAAIVPALRADDTLASLLDKEPGLHVPGCWNALELAVVAILHEGMSRSRACAIASRLARTFGKPLPGPPGITRVFPAAEVLASADLISAGVPRRRAATIRTLARGVCDGQIHLQANADMDTLLARLDAIPGLGRATAQHVAMRALRQPDAFPSSDPRLIRALHCKNARELEKRAEAWRPWRSYAAMYLWLSALACAPANHGRATEN